MCCFESTEKHLHVAGLSTIFHLHDPTELNAYNLPRQRKSVWHHTHHQKCKKNCANCSGSFNISVTGTFSLIGKHPQRGFKKQFMNWSSGLIHTYLIRIQPNILLYKILFNTGIFVCLWHSKHRVTACLRLVFQKHFHIAWK